MNLNLVVDTSNFKPFDFKTLIAPLLLYNQEYEKDQAYYDKLSEQLGALSSAVQGTTNAKGIYDKYNSDFADAAEAFSHGMNINTRAKLDLLRTRYGTEIKQLELAREAMLKIVDARRALMASGKAGDMLYLDTGNLDTYLTNPNYAPMAYDGNLITAKAMADLLMLAKGNATAEEIGQLNPITRKILSRTGYDSKRILNVISELANNGYNFNKISDPEIGKAVASILDNAVLMSGVDLWGDTNTLTKARRYAAAALPALVGDAKISLYENPYEKANLEDELDEKKQARAWHYKLLEMDKTQEQAILLAKAKGEEEKGSVNVGNTSLLGDTDTDFGKNYKALNDLYIPGSRYMKTKYVGHRKGTVEENLLLNIMAAYTDYWKTVAKTPKLLLYEHDLYKSYKEGAISKDLYDKYIKENNTKTGVSKWLKKWGMTEPISTEAYNALKAAGYTDKTFAYHPLEIKNRADAWGKQYSISDTYLGADSEAMKKTTERLITDLGNNGDIYDINYQNKMSAGKSHKFKVEDYNIDTINEKGDSKKTTLKLRDLGYSMATKESSGYIVAFINGGRYYINPSKFGTRVQKMIENANSNYDYYTPEERHQVQDIVTKELIRAVNSYNKSSSTTDSKLL